MVGLWARPRRQGLVRGGPRGDVRCGVRRRWSSRPHLPERVLPLKLSVTAMACVPQNLCALLYVQNSFKSVYAPPPAPLLKMITVVVAVNFSPHLGEAHGAPLRELLHALPRGWGAEGSATGPPGRGWPGPSPAVPRARQSSPQQSTAQTTLLFRLPWRLGDRVA